MQRRLAYAKFVATIKDAGLSRREPYRVVDYRPIHGAQILDQFQPRVQGFGGPGLMLSIIVKGCKQSVEWSPFLRQTVKTHFSSKGELSHGVTQAVHAGI